MTSLKEINKDVLTDVIFSCESKSGMKLYVTSQKSIILGIPHDDMSIYEFLFDTKEDWEKFCEAIWETEHYIAIRKTDFIEFFQALRFVYSYRISQQREAIARQAEIQKELDRQDKQLSLLQDIILSYEEVYNESKVQ